MNTLLEAKFKVAVPSQLQARILARIEAVEAARRRARIATGAIVSCAAAAALVGAGHEASLEMASSGFYQYASLVLSDGSAILTDWRDFAWAIAESAPVVGIALSLGSIAALGGAVRWTLKSYGVRPGFAQIA